MKFIKLHYYSFNKTYPEKSIRTNKEFYLNPTNIVKMTQYSPKKHNKVMQSPFFSTKITLKSGEEFEVCETIKEIKNLSNK